MKVLTEGHKYSLQSFESIGTGSDGEFYDQQTLRFIHKVPVSPGSTDLETIDNGTTNEEVMAVLIDRMKYLQAKFPCRENAIVITKLEESLMWLEKRTSDRKARNVEGKQLA
jgi:hypothetical protein